MKRWAISVGLFLPVLLLFGSHFIHGAVSGRSATGYLQYDMPYYLAIARQYFDGGSAGILASNPFSFLADSPRIYFQPFTFLIGVFWRFLGVPLFAGFVAVWLAAGVLTLRLQMEAFERLFGLDGVARKAVFACFAWGGGLLSVAGLAQVAATGSWDRLFALDFGGGWWFLNFGRTLVFPTEAVYHALVMGAFLVALLRRHGLLILILAALSISHPFTGIEFVLIFGAWLLIERHAAGDRGVRVAHIVAVGLIGIAHVLYYLVFLPRSPEHRSVMEQWSLNWYLGPANLAAAYGLTAFFAVWAIRRDGVRRFFGRPHNRLLAVWFVCSFLLANHQWFMRPMQPVHFTRGYIWASLFLMGAPALIRLLERMFADRRWRLAGAALVLIFLSDNVVWFGWHATRPTGLYLDRADREALDWLEAADDGRDGGRLLAANEDLVSYLATQRTSLRSVYSHWACTPFAAQRRDELMRFFETGEAPWKTAGLLILQRRDEGTVPPPVPASFGSAIRQNGAYTLYELDSPAPPGG